LSSADRAHVDADWIGSLKAVVSTPAITGTAILISGAMPACGSANAMASVIVYVMPR
jgi:hypothetical protein